MTTPFVSSWVAIPLATRQGIRCPDTSSVKQMRPAVMRGGVQQRIGDVSKV
jgi:hypothetical protein